jgi:hypothetical protein
MMVELWQAIDDSLKDGAEIDRDSPTWEVDCLVGLFRTGLPKVAAATVRVRQRALKYLQMPSFCCLC